MNWLCLVDLNLLLDHLLNGHLLTQDSQRFPQKTTIGTESKQEQARQIQTRPTVWRRRRKAKADNPLEVNVCVYCHKPPFLLQCRLSIMMMIRLRECPCFCDVVDKSFSEVTFSSQHHRKNFFPPPAGLVLNHFAFSSAIENINCFLVLEGIYES